jgi:hypothetical protein
MKQLLLLFFSIIFSQKTTEPFDSNALGESREITIALPASFEKNPTKNIHFLFYWTGLLVQSVLWSTILWRGMIYLKWSLLASAKNKNNEHRGQYLWWSR